MPLAVIVTAADRPGLAKAFGEAVHRAGGNIETSRMVTLGGEFVITALVSVGHGDEDALEAALQQDLGGVGFTVFIKATGVPTERPRQLAYRVAAVSLDHPGLVESITETIRAAGGNILHGETESEPSPWSGAPTFSFVARVMLPDAEHGRKLRGALADLAATQNLDIECAPVRNA
jgi:glycine cleavage system regulatory protein